MTGRPVVSDKQIAAQLFKKRGNISAVAKAVGIGRKTTRDRINNSKWLLQKEAEALDFLIDDAEDVITYAIRKERNWQAAKWLLETKAKARGYTRRTELTGAGGGAIDHAVTAQRADPVTPEEIAAARSRFINDSDD